MEEFVSSLRRPFFYDMAIDDRSIYFFLMQYKVLCRANLDDDKVQIINNFSDTIFDESERYIGIYKIKNYLLLGPREKTDDLILYDILNSKVSKIINSEKINFYSFNVFDFKDSFYIISIETANIIKVSINSSSMKTIENHEEILNNAQIGIPVRIKDLIYIPINKIRKMMIFNMDKEEFSSVLYPNSILSIFSMAYNKGILYVTGSDKKIYGWNIYDNEICMISDIPKDLKLFYIADIWFLHSFVYRDILFLFPCFADKILMYYIGTREIKTLELSGEEESIEGVYKELKNGRVFPAKYSIVQRQDEKVFFRSSKTRILYELDLQTGIILKHYLYIDNIYKDRIYPPAIDGVMLEKYYTDGLDTIIQAIEERRNSNILKKYGVGKNLYNKIRE